MLYQVGWRQREVRTWRRGERRKMRLHGGGSWREEGEGGESAGAGLSSSSSIVCASALAFLGGLRLAPCRRVGPSLPPSFPPPYLVSPPAQHAIPRGHRLTLRDSPSTTSPCLRETPDPCIVVDHPFPFRTDHLIPRALHGPKPCLASPFQRACLKFSQRMYKLFYLLWENILQAISWWPRRQEVG